MIPAQQPKRIRQLTWKAMASYEERVKKLEGDLQTIKNSLADISPSTFEVDLSKVVDSYDKQWHEFTTYLSGVNTKESICKIEHLEQERQHFVMEVARRRDDIIRWRQENTGVFSPLASISRKSGRSRASDRLLLKMAEVNAAQKTSSIAEKEAALQKERAELEEKEKIANAKKTRRMEEIEADLKLLSHTRKVTAARAEMEVLENSLKNGSQASESIDLNIPNQTAEDKVAAFISVRENPAPAVDDTPFKEQHRQVSSNSHNFMSYMLKKDLLFHRLTTFDDNPEYYRSWKTSFNQVMIEIEANPSEEIDLMIKWLGKESRKHALNLKNVYLTDPSKAVKQIWERLDERFGSPESIHKVITNKLDNFQKIYQHDTTRWYDLADTLAEIQALKEDPVFTCALAYFDSSIGIAPVLLKLPLNTQERWASKVNAYKASSGKLFPPFKLFVDFVKTQANIRNESSRPLSAPVSASPRRQVRVSVNKTETFHPQRLNRKSPWCPLHESCHSLNECKTFRYKSLVERKQFLRDKRICFKCCESADHRASECSERIRCTVCGNENHPGALHFYTQSERGIPPRSEQFNQRSAQGGETDTAPKTANRQRRPPDSVNNVCTEICGNGYGRSCAKIVLVDVHHKNEPSNIVRCYALLDDQSNRSLVEPQLLDKLGVKGPDHEFTIKSCSGVHLAHGRRANDCVVTSVDGKVSYAMPSLIECSNIPNNRDEICTPDVALAHSHLADMARQIPELDSSAEILLLIGRDVSEAHQVKQQIVGPPGTPFAQQLDLGWVVIGEVCLGGVHKKDQVNVYKTQVLGNGRPSLFDPCDSQYVITDELDPVFIRTVDDNQRAMSVDDRAFLHIMESGFQKAPSGRWSAPLPFREDRPRLPNNRSEALKRAVSFDTHLKKHDEKKGHMVEFMGKIFDNGHAELAPPLRENEECWYLPVFGVYNQKKPGKVRGVFDSSAEFQGVSLNSVLYSGPDLSNSMLGVLMRFRKDKVAVAGDIEQMFYCFEVDKTDRNFLRFFWYRDNEPANPLVEYRMCRHVFGNSPSPAIATYGLRKSVEASDRDVKSFVEEDFYVDDGLISKPSTQEAVTLIQKTQSSLSQSGLRLHKIVSNSSEVMSCFPSEDLAKDLKCVDLEGDLPVQRSLGIGWDLNSDSFVFRTSIGDRPVTKRGILSTVNSMFDPLGFLAPYIILGKLILREAVLEQRNWDEPVSADIRSKWVKWCEGVETLHSTQIPRCYFLHSLTEMKTVELHVFADASEKAISAVAYVVGRAENGDTHVGFVLGKSKIAPSKGHTIPRLELCAAVLAVEVKGLVDKMGVKFSLIKYYSDSSIVLGYIHNHSKRFFTYVSNRIQKIRQVSSPDEWNHVASELNPADVGSRGATLPELEHGPWLSGPSFLQNREAFVPEFFPLVDPDKDVEVRQAVSIMATSIGGKTLGIDRFERFSSWKRLVGAMSVLLHIASSITQRCGTKRWHVCKRSRSVESQEQVERVILKEAQAHAYSKEIHCLSEKRNLPKDSPILPLSPYLDEHGLLRVGGRLRASECSFQEKCPIIVPGKSHVARLLVGHFHELVRHQGRHFTEGSVRAAGYWVVGGKRVVSSLIHSCVTCRKLRGRFMEQKMADLPADRVVEAAPFSHVGVDVFGPWHVVTRRTRGGQASSKRWAVMFSCLTIRAVHIEVIEEMSSSSFINALRRFLAVRGKVKTFRSDRGTNFVGAVDYLNVEAVNVEEEKMSKFLTENGCRWLFNAPHSSHMAGAWERMIGIARRILESMLLDVKTLTHEVLVTVMAEISAIMNARPIVPVSSDPENHEVLSPSALLTYKLGCDEKRVGELDLKDLYKEQWKRVQLLADQFWVRWKKEYLQTLQKRCKWGTESTPVALNDVVLLRDSEQIRNHWGLGRVSRVFPSNDGRIRKVEVTTFRDGKVHTYIRPIVELVLLVQYKD